MVEVTEVKARRLADDSAFLDLDRNLGGKILEADRGSWASFWDPSGCIFVDFLEGVPGRLPLRDVMTVGPSSALCFAAENVELAAYLGQFGEIFSAGAAQGVELQVFHCLTYVDALDEPRSDGLSWGEDSTGRYVYSYDDLAFDEAKLGELGISALPQLRGGSAFYTPRAQREISDLCGPRGMGVRFISIKYS